MSANKKELNEIMKMVKEILQKVNNLDERLKKNRNE
jgi:hypothetical protein